MTSKKIDVENWSYKSLFTILFFLLIAIVGLLKLTQKASPASAGWFNDSWMYRKAVSISNTSGSNLTDFQVSLSIGTSALINAGKMKSDCSDIRITDNTGKLLNFWIEENNPGCNTPTDTKIWLKAPTLPTSGATVFVYYGNPSATSVQNGEQVFEFFDDFNDGSIDTSKWTTYVSGGSVTESSGTLQTVGNNTWNTNGISTNNSFNRSSGYNIVWQFKSSLEGANDMIGFSPKILNYQVGILHYPTGDTRWYEWRSGTGTDLSSPYTNNTWYILKTTLKNSTGYALYKDGNLLKDDTTFADNNHSITMQQYASGKISYFNYVYVTKYASTDPTASLQSEELSPAPIAYWKFDEGIGTTAYDSTSNRNNGIFGTGSSAPAWQNEDMCISGKCLKFDGTNDYVSSLNTNSINISGSNLTLSGWVKLNSCSGANAIIHKEVQYTLAFFSSGSVCQATYADSSNWSYASFGYHGAITKNTWHHIAATKDSSNIVTIYLDGKVIISKSFGSSISQTANPLILGAYMGGEFHYIDGFIDEPKIYPYSRTAAQIKSDYNAGKSHASSNKGSSVNLGGSNKSGEFLSDGLVGYWKMDENTGTSLTDSSGIGYTATFAAGGAAPTWSSGKFGVGISFDGSDDYINFGNPGLSSLSNATISFWRKASNTNNWLLFQGQAANYYLMAVYNQGNFYHENVGGQKTIYVDGNITTAPIYDTNWHHYVISGVDLSTWTTLTLNNYGGWQYNGIIDELRIYNRALSPSEVSSLYNWAPGPVLHLKMDENTGTQANDTSGNNNNGTLGGGNASYRPTWTTGKYGSGTLYDGNDYIDVADSPTLRPAYGLTMESWVYYPSSATTACIICKQQGSSSANSYAVWIESDTLMSGVNISIAGGNTANHGAMPVNSWVHIATVWDTNTNTLATYINGIKNSTTAVTTATSLSYDSNGVFIGGDDNDGNNIPDFWNNSGIKQDDVKIYNYARTQKQIVEDMNAGHPAGGSPVGSQLAYWKFDEGYGTQVNNIGNGGIGLSGVFGTGNSAPTWTNNGKFGKALSFNGSTNYINFGNNASVQNDTAVTISAWIKKNNSTGIQTIASQGGANCPPYYMYQFKTDTNKLYMMLFGPDSYYYYAFPNAIVSNNVWQYVAIVINDGTTATDTGTATVYIDGVNKGSTTWTGNRMKESGKNFYIGTNAWSCNIPTEFFNGLIDEVKVYNYALTDDEIKIDYNRNSALQMGSLSSGTGNTAPSTAGSQEYCIPGDTVNCSPPVAEWKMDEKSGSIAYDTSGLGNTGAITGATWTTGKIGTALNFDGNDYVTSTNIAIEQNMTWEAWYRSSVAQSEFLIDQRSADIGVQPVYIYSDGRIQFHDSTAGTYSTTTGVAKFDNNWHHVAVTGTATSKIVYFDGINVGSTNSGITPQTARAVYLGTRHSLSSFFNGKIDQVKIFNYARSPAQIAWDYNKGGPIGWWKFDECQGSTVYDWSGIGNTGSISIGASGTQNSLGTCQVGTSAAWTSGATGKLNSSLNFDGNDDYVSINDHPSLEMPNTYSLSTWVKLNSVSGWQTIIQKGNAGTRYMLWLLDDEIGAVGHKEGTYTLSTNANFTTGIWYNIVFTFDYNTSPQAKIYKNGILLNSSNTTGIGQTPDTGATTLKIGYDGSYSYTMDGQIDDVRVYNYALTATQVKILYNGGAVRFN